MSRPILERARPPAMPEGHPLTERERIRSTDSVGERFMLKGRDRRPETPDHAILRRASGPLSADPYRAPCEAFGALHCFSHEKTAARM